MAGCGRLIERPDANRTHLPSGQDHVYAGFPPAAGPHDSDPLPAGVYTEPLKDLPVGSRQPSLMRAVHSLEHGYVIIFYKDISADEQRTLRDRFGYQRKIILAPAEAMDSRLALVAWERIIKCAEVGVAAIDEFVTAYREGSTAPEPNAQ